MPLTRVQFVAGSSGTGTLTANITPSAPNGLLIHVEWSHATVTLSGLTVTGETHVAWGSEATVSIFATTAHSQWYRVNSCASGGSSKTIQATFSGTHSGGAISVWEVAGQDTSDLSDATPTSNSGTGQSYPDAVAPITTNTVGAAVFSVMLANTSTISSADPDYTTSDNPTDSGYSYAFALYDMDVGSPAQKTPNATVDTGSANWLAHTVAVKPAGAAGGGSVVGGRLVGGSLLGGHLI